MRKIWKCGYCNRKINSNIEPRECPCGSDNIEEKEVVSRTEEFLKSVLQRFRI